MCIRDRCTSLVTMAVFAGVVYVFRRELLLEFLTDMDAYEIAFYALQIQCPVSYTHLDVYKRQALFCRI